MSEFSIEEKANAYDVALNKAKTLLSKCKYDRDRTTMIYRAEDIESIFPELKEFSDEEIKKWLIGYFQEYKSIGIIEEFGNGLKVTDVISWLEKQGEQKSANKVEPKFKEGDWVVFNGLTLYINEVVKGYYRTISKSGTPNSYDWNIDNAARLWTIKDAKDGDILVTENEKPFIFKGLDISHSNKPIAYGGIVDSGYFIPNRDNCTNRWTDGNAYPATKEQRDLLFKEIKKAGYKWNKNKKELKRL